MFAIWVELLNNGIDNKELKYMRISWVKDEKNEIVKLNKEKHIKVIDNEYVLEFDMSLLINKELDCYVDLLSGDCGF